MQEPVSDVSSCRKAWERYISLSHDPTGCQEIFLPAGSWLYFGVISSIQAVFPPSGRCLELPTSCWLPLPLPSEHPTSLTMVRSGMPGSRSFHWFSLGSQPLQPV